MKQRPIYLGLLYVIISAAADATLPIFGKAAYHLDMGPASILFVRNIFAFTVLSVCALWSRQAILSRSWLVYGQGILLIAQEVLFFYALRFIDASTGVVVFYTYPIIVALLSVLIYHKRPSIPFLIGLVTALTGVVLISGLSSTARISWSGLLLAFLASVIFALFSLLGQKTVTDAHPFTLTASFSLVAMLILGISFPNEVINITQLNTQQLILGCGTAVMNSLLGLVFFLKAIAAIGAPRTAMACTIEPVISILLATTLFHERLNYIQWAGTLLVVISIALSMSRRTNNQGDLKPT